LSGPYNSLLKSASKGISDFSVHFFCKPTGWKRMVKPGSPLPIQAIRQGGWPHSNPMSETALWG
jgi:hypothetical protein